jgi:hypothetical protein
MSDKTYCFSIDRVYSMSDITKAFLFTSLEKTEQKINPFEDPSKFYRFKSKQTNREHIAGKVYKNNTSDPNDYLYLTFYPTSGEDRYVVEIILWYANRITPTRFNQLVVYPDGTTWLTNKIQHDQYWIDSSEVRRGWIS